MPVSVPHSFLFVPGDRPECFAQACGAGADVVIVDLEEVVALSDTAKARAAVSAWLPPTQPEADGSAISVDGAMVDRPVLRKAWRILADAVRDAALARNS